MFNIYSKYLSSMILHHSCCGERQLNVIFKKYRRQGFALGSYWGEFEGPLKDEQSLHKFTPSFNLKINLNLNINININLSININSNLKFNPNLNINITSKRTIT